MISFSVEKGQAAAAALNWYGTLSYRLVGLKFLLFGFGFVIIGSILAKKLSTAAAPYCSSN